MNIDEKTAIVSQALTSVWRDDVRLAGPSRVEHLVKAAREKAEFESAFDTAKRGAESSVIEILEMLFWAAKVGFVLIELWNEAGGKLTKPEFEKQATDRVEEAKSKGKIEKRSFKKLKELVDELFKTLTAFPGKKE